MLLTVIPLENPGPPSPVPPPTAPKPRKDNAKLQRLIRKAAKRSGVQSSPTQPQKSYRSILSPVSEADLESPEPPAASKPQLPSLNLPPRFQTRAVTHRVPSPYPKQRSFTFTVSEQHSLNQYLSPSPIPDTPSQHSFGTSSRNSPFLYPLGGTTPELASRDASTPHARSPRFDTSNVTSEKRPEMSRIQTLAPPIVIIQEPTQQSSRLISPNTDVKVHKTSPDQLVPKTETVSCTPDVPSPLSTEYKPVEQVTIMLTPALADTSEPKPECPRVAETPCVMPSLSSNPMDVSKTITEPQATNAPVEASANVSEVTPKTLPEKVISPPKTSAFTQGLANKEASASPGKALNSENMNLLTTAERPKPAKKKPGGGWARLVKHLVVEPEEPKFPEQDKGEIQVDKAGDQEGAVSEGTQQSKGSRANKMWDALLYRMATATKTQETPGSTAPPLLPFLRSRLPLLLHRPRFDARKLKEAASRPLRRVTAFFHRRTKDKDKEPSTFNRTASGWSIRGGEAEQEKGTGETTVDGEVKALQK